MDPVIKWIDENINQEGLTVAVYIGYDEYHSPDIDQSERKQLKELLLKWKQERLLNYTPSEIGGFKIPEPLLVEGAEFFRKVITHELKE